MVGQRQQRRVQGSCSIIRPFCVAQKLFSQAILPQLSRPNEREQLCSWVGVWPGVGRAGLGLSGNISFEVNSLGTQRRHCLRFQNPVCSCVHSHTYIAGINILPRICVLLPGVQNGRGEEEWEELCTDPALVRGPACSRMSSGTGCILSSLCIMAGG